MLQRLTLGLVLLVAGAPLLPAGSDNAPRPYDWPQWQGPDRTAVSHERGLLKTWPKNGPSLVWQATGLGGGYSTPSIACGRIFAISFRGKDEVVWALDEATGKELWNTRIAEARPAEGKQAREGSRGTPTIDGDRLYALGESGDLVCLSTASGQRQWHKNPIEDFGGSEPRWGYSESPLIDGDKLICTPGGSAATLAALDKKTGEPVWKATVPGGDGPAYSSVIAGELAGQRQYVQFVQHGMVGIAAEDGRFLWRYDAPANRTANCSTPIFHDDCVFAASGYNTGGGLVALTRRDSETKAEQVYFTKQMKNQHGGMVLVDGYLYGANDPGSLVCLDFKTGKVMWEDRRPGKGSVTYADGCLYYRNEGGPVVLIEASPKGYSELGRFQQLKRSGQATWPHPVIANGKLYIRDQGLLLCYSLK
jgi:outer membrane protein assembly factor BamB